MRPQMVCNIGEEPWSFIAGRWDHPTVETRQSLFHQGMPGVVIPCRCSLLQHHGVAHGLDPHQAQTACKRFILRERDRFGGHRVSQPCTLFLAVRHDRFFNATVHLLLGPIRRPHKPVETCQLHKPTHQTHPAGPHCGTHQMYREDQAMPEGKTGDAVKKRHDRRTLVEALVVGAPRLQCRAGHLKHLGRLTLRDTLGLQSTIRCQEVSAFEAIPALVASLVASLRLLDYRSHSDLLWPSCAFVCVIAQDGEVACSFQPFAGSSHCLLGAVIETKWPTP
jgi:hypothetical protein